MELQIDNNDVMIMISNDTDSNFFSFMIYELKIIMIENRIYPIDYDVKKKKWYDDYWLMR